MNVSTQITKIEIFAFIDVLVLKLLRRKGFFYKQKRQFKKIVNFTGNILQTYK